MFSVEVPRLRRKKNSADEREKSGGCLQDLSSLLSANGGVSWSDFHRLSSWAEQFSCRSVGLWEIKPMFLRGPVYQQFVAPNHTLSYSKQ